MDRHTVISWDSIKDDLEGDQIILPDGRRRKNKKYTDIDGVKVKLSSKRYLVFKQSSICAHCGIEGTLMAVERHVVGSINYHLNLYAIDRDGNEVLMTKDHIKPKSKGGSEDIENFQTLCCECNQTKGCD